MNYLKDLKTEHRGYTIASNGAIKIKQSPSKTKSINMGTIYKVACKKCKVTRDLDKFDEAREVYDRADALNFSEVLKLKSFRSALLVSFMTEHIGHDCVFFNEHSDCDEELDSFYDENEYNKDKDYWK